MLKEHENYYATEKILILLLMNDEKTYQKIYNLIEFVWHSAKKYIAHRLFESESQLEKLLNKLLNVHEASGRKGEIIIIKWKCKIKNKGNAVY
ncbi:hypothetical protein [Nostoc sp.]|uniref:hypothetical protein n=1 Tax=Nostoc sp. TaxID=1180 RepID=UPI003FA5930D